MKDEPWYGVKCVFIHHDLKKRNGQNNYEERIVLVHADSFEEAIDKAEKEAKQYCEDLDGAAEYLELCNAFRIEEHKIEDGTEIYSLITKSDLNPKEYLKIHHDTGGEFTQKSDE